MTPAPVPYQHPFPSLHDTVAGAFSCSKGALTMLALTDRVAITGALNNFDLSPDLRAAIGLRAWQLYVEDAMPLDRDAKLFIVQGGDTPDIINQTIGVSITGDDPEDPGFEWIEGHETWFELAYTSEEGVPVRIFVEDGPATEFGIHHFCLTHFWPASGACS